MRRGLGRLRRAAVLAVALLLVPTAALGLFRSPATANLSVGTATLTAPISLSIRARLKAWTGMPLFRTFTC
jgi:hypothetical protein